MKILIINYFFSPVINAHVYRWSQLANFWADQGHEVEVISGALNGYSKKDIINNVKIIRVGLNIKSRTSTNISYAKESRYKGYILKIKNNINLIFKKIYRKLYWPDAWWHWLPFVVWCGWRSKEKFDMVFTYSPSISSHIAALLLKNTDMLRSAVWVADYGDPFSVSYNMQPNNFSLYDSFNKFIEANILRRANTVSFTNIVTKNSYNKIFGNHCYFKVIPHLVDIDTFYSASNRITDVIERKKNIIHLVYIGGFHKNIREPYRFLELFSKIKNVNFSLSIYGPENGFNLHSLCACSDLISYNGEVSREVAIELMRGADILVNIDNSDCIMTPSKIVEYIATGKPIINIDGNGGPIDVMDQYKNYGYAFNTGLEDFDEVIFVALSKFIFENAGKVADRKIVDKILYKNNIKTISKIYLDTTSAFHGDK